MLVKEYQIVLPFSVEEYQVGQLYTVAEASKGETGGGEGVEVLDNKPYENGEEKGQYTKKIYHLNSKVPSIIKRIAPKGSLELCEEAWNAYPYCKTVLTNTYMKDNFFIEILTWHKPDMGELDNVHNVEGAREVVNIDIAEKDKDCKDDEDPTKYKSEVTGRGPLSGDWKESLKSNTDTPHMCCYKLVKVKFKWLGLQETVERFIHKFEKKLFTRFHKKLFCTQDQWINMTMDDIRALEEDTKKQLDDMRGKGEVKGTKG